MEIQPGKYTNFAIILHWLMALLIFFMFGLGWFMVDLEKGSAERSYYFAMHKSTGLTLALLVLIRFIWRSRNKPPQLPGFLTSWERTLADITHTLLYFFMFLQPISGYISSSFSGYKTRFWGIPLPHWGWNDQVLNEFFTEIHEISSVALMCLIIFHLLGVIHHLWARQYEILERILPHK